MSESAHDVLLLLSIGLNIISGGPQEITGLLVILMAANKVIADK